MVEYGYVKVRQIYVKVRHIYYIKVRHTRLCASVRHKLGTPPACFEKVMDEERERVREREVEKEYLKVNRVRP